MKKVIVLLAAAALLASPAFGAVRNSKHDLSSSSTSTSTIKSTNVDEVCVFCHTPHGAATGLLAPLWNRSGVGAGTFAATDLYNSATLDQTNSNPTTVLNAVNNSDAPLCLSCHDGASLAGGLLNPPASAGNNQPTFNTGNDAVTGNAIIDDGGNGLTNDHPIGMDYGAVQAADTSGPGGTSDFVAETVANQEVDGLPLYTANGVMWCSTCHDVHGEGGGTPFLNKSNAGSALCLTCHVK